MVGADVDGRIVAEEPRLVAGGGEVEDDLAVGSDHLDVGGDGGDGAEGGHVVGALIVLEFLALEVEFREVVGDGVVLGGRLVGDERGIGVVLVDEAEVFESADELAEGVLGGQGDGEAVVLVIQQVGGADIEAVRERVSVLHQMGDALAVPDDDGAAELQALEVGLLRLDDEGTVGLVDLGVAGHDGAVEGDASGEEEAGEDGQQCGGEFHRWVFSL